MADNLQYTGTQYTNRKARMSVHSHEFNEGNPLAERRTRWAVVLTAVMMVVEIAGGWTYNSMALLADGWHMSSHTLALGMAAFAYLMARRLANDRRLDRKSTRLNSSH